MFSRISWLLALAVVLFAFVPLRSDAKEVTASYVQLASIEVYPASLAQYCAAVKEHAETATRVEPGVLALNVAFEIGHPTHVLVFEVYRDIAAYHAHLATAHFLKYKSTTLRMVKSLKITRLAPIVLAVNSRI